MLIPNLARKLLWIMLSTTKSLNSQSLSVLIFKFVLRVIARPFTKCRHSKNLKAFNYKIKYAPIVQRPSMLPFQGSDPSSNLGRGVTRDFQSLRGSLIPKDYFFESERFHDEQKEFCINEE